MTAVQQVLAGAGAEFEHTQSSPAAVWVVAHNLGKRPDVATRTIGGVEFDAEIAHINTNQLEVRFATPQTGIARCT